MTLFLYYHYVNVVVTRIFSIERISSSYVASFSLDSKHCPAHRVLCFDTRNYLTPISKRPSPWTHQEYQFYLLETLLSLCCKYYLEVSILRHKLSKMCARACAILFFNLWKLPFLFFRCSVLLLNNINWIIKCYSFWHRSLLSTCLLYTSRCV